MIQETRNDRQFSSTDITKLSTDIASAMRIFDQSHVTQSNSRPRLGLKQSAEEVHSKSFSNSYIRMKTRRRDAAKCDLKFRFSPPFEELLGIAFRMKIWVFKRTLANLSPPIAFSSVSRTNFRRRLINRKWSLHKLGCVFPYQSQTRFARRKLSLCWLPARFPKDNQIHWPSPQTHIAKIVCVRESLNGTAMIQSAVSN
jgi:hypothetical protein